MGQMPHHSMVLKDALLVDNQHRWTTAFKQWQIHKLFALNGNSTCRLSNNIVTFKLHENSNIFIVTCFLINIGQLSISEANLGI